MKSEYIYDIGYAYRGLSQSISQARSNPKHISDWLEYFNDKLNHFKCHGSLSNKILELTEKFQLFQNLIDKMSKDEALWFQFGELAIELKMNEKIHPKIAESTALISFFKMQIEMWKGEIEDEIDQYEIIQLNEETLLNSKKLKQGPEALLPKDVWSKLSDFQKQDMQEAVNCLLYGLWTSSGMVSMRTAESALAGYYKDLTGKTNKSWGVMLSDLKQEQNADIKLLGYMDFLKDIRNNLQHPNERIDDRKAEQTLFHTIYVLEIIYS